jgi:hypothetical protein
MVQIHSPRPFPLEPLSYVERKVWRAPGCELGVILVESLDCNQSFPVISMRCGMNTTALEVQFSRE